MTAITLRSGYNGLALSLRAKEKHLTIKKSTALLIIAGLVLLFLVSVQLIAWNVYHIILWKMIVGLGGSMILGSALFVICKISDNIRRQEMIE